MHHHRTISIAQSINNFIRLAALNLGQVVAAVAADAPRHFFVGRAEDADGVAPLKAALNGRYARR
jgi:hypothetical protein